MLSACAHTSGLLSPESLYPVALTQCADEPEVPDRPGPGLPRTDEQKATYTKNLRAFGLDCKDTVGSWAERRAKYVEQYEKESFGSAERLWRKVRGKKGSAK